MIPLFSYRRPPSRPTTFPGMCTLWQLYGRDYFCYHTHICVQYNDYISYILHWVSHTCLHAVSRFHRLCVKMVTTHLSTNGITIPSIIYYTGSHTPVYKRYRDSINYILHWLSHTWQHAVSRFHRLYITLVSTRLSLYGITIPINDFFNTPIFKWNSEKHAQLKL